MPRKEKLKNKLIVNRVYPEQYPEGLILFNLSIRTIYDIAVSQHKDFQTLLEAEGFLIDLPILARSQDLKDLRN